MHSEKCWCHPLKKWLTNLLLWRSKQIMIGFWWNWRGGNLRKITQCDSNLTKLFFECVECFISASSQKTAAAAKSSAAEKQHLTPPKLRRHRRSRPGRKPMEKEPGLTEVHRTCEFGSVTFKNSKPHKTKWQHNSLKLETYEFCESRSRELC